METSFKYSSLPLSLCKLPPRGGKVDSNLFALPNLLLDAKAVIEEGLAMRFRVHPRGLGAILSFILDEQG
jgi:hypothetical protein